MTRQTREDSFGHSKSVIMCFQWVVSSMDSPSLVCSRSMCWFARLARYCLGRLAPCGLSTACSWFQYLRNLLHIDIVHLVQTSVERPKCPNSIDPPRVWVNSRYWQNRTCFCLWPTIWIDGTFKKTKRNANLIYRARTMNHLWISSCPCRQMS